MGAEPEAMKRRHSHFFKVFELNSCEIILEDENRLLLDANTPTTLPL